MVSDEGDEVVFRHVRSAKGKSGNRGGRPGTCRYTKAAWTECDATSNLRSRTLTLKRGDKDTCEATKTESRKCKKSCRYDKGAWSDCNVDNMMERIDQLKAGSEPTCDSTKRKTKKCKGKGKKPHLTG